MEDIGKVTFKIVRSLKKERGEEKTRDKIFGTERKKMFLSRANRGDVERKVVEEEGEEEEEDVEQE